MKLFNNIKKKEIELLDKTIDLNDLQIHNLDDSNSTVLINKKVFKEENLFIGISNEDVHELKVHHLNQNLSFGNEGLLRVICDIRKKDDIKLLVTVGERECLELSNSSDDESLLIILLETKDFLQFLLYDGKLDQKVCRTLVIDEKSKDSLRCIAFSIIERNFKGFYKKISEPCKTEVFK